MITMQVTKIACDDSETAQTIKPLITKVSVDVAMILVGRFAIRAPIMPNRIADATAERVPQAAPKPAAR